MTYIQMSTLSHNFWLGDHSGNRPVLGESLTYLYFLNYTVVLCLSFTFLWYGIVWYSYAMIWYFYAMLWDIKKWFDMVCLAADLWLPGLKMSGSRTGELQFRTCKKPSFTPTIFCRRVWVIISIFPPCKHKM